MRAPSNTAEHRAAILPIYLVCDMSSSMSEHSRASAVHEAISALREAVWQNPVVSDCCRVAVVAFASTAWLATPLCDLATAEDLPTLLPAGLTSYASAFRLLHKTIRDDTAQLDADGYRVRNPLVFFLSDGAPTDRADEWRSALARLVDPRFPLRPDIVSFGVAGADERILAEVATARCYVARQEASVRAAIGAIGNLVIRGVIDSGARGRPALPDHPPSGFDEIGPL
jgi:uncharacterized protein YegL